MEYLRAPSVQSVHLPSEAHTLAFGAAVAKLARAAPKTKEEISKIAERMAPQVTGEYVRGAARTETAVHPFRRHFEELAIGESLLTHRRTVSEADIVNFGGISSGSVSESQTLTVTATSSNPSLIPTPTVRYSSPTSGGYLTFTPVPVSHGVDTIGLVVDDAIIMLENIHRRMKRGEPPLLAAFRGARQVGMAVVATTLVLAAAFVAAGRDTFAQGCVLIREAAPVIGSASSTYLRPG